MFHVKQKRAPLSALLEIVSRETLSLKPCVITGFDDQQHHHDQEQTPNKLTAMLQRQPGPEHRTDDLADGHHQTQLPDDVAGETEQQDRRNITRHIHHLGRRRGAEEIKAEAAYKQEDQEAAGPRTKKAVIESNPRPNRNCRCSRAPTT